MKHPDEEIVALFRQLGTQVAVGRQLDMAQSQVSRVLIRNGIRIGRGSWIPKKGHIDMEEAARLYREGWLLRELGERYSTDPEPLPYVLRVRGIARRNRGFRIGSLNPSWKDGRGNYRDSHYRNLAYAVVLLVLGWPLSREEEIHHKDEDYRNNDPSNLMIFDSHSDHQKYHQQLLRLRREGREVDSTLLAIENGGRELPSPFYPIVFGLEKGRPVLLDTTGKRLKCQTVFGQARRELPRLVSRLS